MNVNCYGMPLREDIINHFQAKDLKPITSDNAKNGLEKKHIDILTSMDFTPYQIIMQDKNPLYILYDNDRGSFYAFVDCVKEIETYTTSKVENLLSLLPEDYFKDYEFNIEKVFNDAILNYPRCFLDKDFSNIKSGNINEQSRTRTRNIKTRK